MIRIENVTKRFYSKVVVDSISLNIEQGKLFGLIGPNGAGKTTTISMIIGALSADSGTIQINGGAPRDPSVRRMLGIVPQTLAVYENLSAYDNLDFFGRLYGMEGKELKDRIQDVFEIVNLTERGHERVRKFSGGMKRRLNIAAALLHRPSLLILDEPTVDVDPQSRNAIFESLRRLKDEGCTIVLTSHYLEEAQKLCDRVAILDNGKVVAHDTVGKLIATYGGKSVLIVETGKGRIEIETDEPVKEIIRLNEEDTILTLQMESPNLEKAFLNITGKQLRD